MAGTKLPAIPPHIPLLVPLEGVAQELPLLTQNQMLTTHHQQTAINRTHKLVLRGEMNQYISCCLTTKVLSSIRSLCCPYNAQIIRICSP